VNTLTRAAICTSLIFVLTAIAYAGSAQWNFTPTSTDWNTATNWTPTTVPNGPSDTATFDLSNTTNLSISADSEVTAITFSPVSPGYTIAVNPSFTLTVSGVGIFNQSAITQQFVTNGGEAVDGGFGSIRFINTATAGTAATFVNRHGTNNFFGGITLFSNTSTAGSATFINNNGTVGGDQFQGETVFIDNSTAGNGTFINNPSIISGVENGGGTKFNDSSTAGNATVTNNDGCLVYFANSSRAASATIINNGAATVGAFGGETSFGVFESDTASADSATLIANGGTGGGGGGTIYFFGESTGGQSRIEVFGNGSLDITNRHPPSVTVGSIEGDGDIFLGANNLTVGSNQLSATFSGIVDDTGSGGSLTKIGNGTLVLSGENTYSGGTIIQGGKLLINNTTGSGTGIGPVQVNAGQLGGSGVISGNVTVGDASHSRGTLSPGDSGQSCDTLTIQSTLTLQSDGNYKFNLNTRTAKSDSVVANGVTINSGARFGFGGIGHRTLPIGIVFTAIENTSANPIVGTFSNLPDQSTFTKGNTYQASYHGGDGNDLTLTVIR